ncbi:MULTISPECIES: hypothetical protein [unclassified Curtobacterium]|uniref:hypothetical protein n=1 Tax=unclassified Curtobacterium TaxID=257496 RepID=UPI0039AEFEBF
MSGGLFRRFRALHQDGERGAVLVTVIGTAAVLMIIVTTVLATAVSGTIKSNRDEDWNNAGAAAYAGLADYQSRISADNSYEQYGALGTSFSTGSTFSSTKGNKAFSTSTNGEWVGVPGSDNVAADGSRDGKYRQSFRYEVNNANYYGQGVVKVRVTGKAGTVTRSLVANLKGTGFINYLYFTDYESGDPAITGDSCTPLHWNETAPRGVTKCAAIQFAARDTLAGPVRSNDQFTICGATFQNDVQSTTADGVYSKPSGCSSAIFAKNSTTGLKQVQHVSSIGLPPTNTNLMQETRSDLKTSTVPQPGCLYTGPTTIKFTSAGKMTVYSPWTKAVQITGDPASGSTAAPACGTPGYSSSGNTLGSPGGQTLDVLPNNLAYVQNVPSTTGDPNRWGSTTPSNYSCKSADGSQSGNGVGYPAAGETIKTLSVSTPYGCQSGDVFVQGQFKGAMTVAAQNYVYVTGDLTYVNSGASANPNLLGLVGQKAVWVYNPVASSMCTDFTSTYWDRQGYSSWGYQCVPMNWVSGSRAAKDFEIDAAIASNNGTFTVQNYDQGRYAASNSRSAIRTYGQGTLTVLGSIAQKYRGPVATTGGTGFSKAYSYDKRLLTTAPPKFLQPVATTYGATTQVEVKPAFSADGTPAS